MMDIRAGRPATLASNGIVTCSHVLASRAGAEILREGGSAIDAAVAASAALSVLYPHMTGIGGDAFWLIYDAHAKAVRYIDGGGRATSRGTVEAFTKRGLAEVPYRGVLPGTLDGARRRRELDHGACGLWATALQALPGERDRLCARWISDDGAARALAGRRAPGAGEEPRGRRDLPPGRTHAHQPRSRAHPGSHRQRRLVRLLRRRGGARTGALLRRQRRLLHAEQTSRRRLRAGASR